MIHLLASEAHHLGGEKVHLTLQGCCFIYEQYLFDKDPQVNSIIISCKCYNLLHLILTTTPKPQGIIISIKFLCHVASK